MPQADPQRLVHCVKLKQELPGLQKPPFPTELGQRIFEQVSHQAWEQWLKESVRYINTYRIDLSTKQGTEFLVQQLKVWLGLEEGELANTAWTPPKEAAPRSESE